MRLGVTLPPQREAEVAVAAEALGVGFVHVVAEPGTESVVAAPVVAATTTARVVVTVHLGHEHPVTLAEDIAVLDNLANGRIAVIAELGALSAEDAVEELTLLRASWSGRPVQHRGRRWRVPAGLPDHAAPDAVIVTPPPAQLVMPLWVEGEAGDAAAKELGLPAVVAGPGDIDSSTPVAPGRCTLVNELDEDRATVVQWAQAGATHLACALPDPAGLDALSRWLIPEVAMVDFPRVVADAPRPMPWPRASA